MIVRSVVFVCPHGALKSRLAAVFFNGAAPQGWWATSAGLEPQDEPSVHAERLLAGTGAAGLLERDPPRSLSDLPSADRVVAIDCDVPGAELWRLSVQEAGEPMREELRERAEGLARQVNHSR